MQNHAFPVPASLYDFIMQIEQDLYIDNPTAAHS